MATNTGEQTLAKKKKKKTTQFCYLKLQKDFCTACFLVLLCLEGKSLLILFLCSVQGSVHLLPRVCQEPPLLSDPLPAPLSSASVSPLTSAREWPSPASPHLGSHRSEMSGEETKSACQKHMTASQFKGQCSASRVNDTECNAHRRGGEEFLLTGPDSGWGDFYSDLVSIHPFLCKTWAHISYDLVSKCALGQVMPPILQVLQLQRCKNCQVIESFTALWRKGNWCIFCFLFYVRLHLWKLHIKRLQVLQHLSIAIIFCFKSYCF